MDGMARVIETNPYLRDPELRARMILRSVASSSAVEGIRKPFEAAPLKRAVRLSIQPAVFPSRSRGTTRQSSGSGRAEPESIALTLPWLCWTGIIGGDSM